MGIILWEDSVQRDLKRKRLYTGVTAETEAIHHGVLTQIVNTVEERTKHISYAARRSRYFAHTKTGKRYAARPIVRVNVGENWASQKRFAP
jgi:hypothetical protein